VNVSLPLADDEPFARSFFVHLANKTKKCWKGSVTRISSFVGFNDPRRWFTERFCSKTVPDEGAGHVFLLSGADLRGTRVEEKRILLR